MVPRPTTAALAILPLLLDLSSRYSLLSSWSCLARPSTSLSATARSRPSKLVDGRTRSTAVRHEKCRQFDSAFRAGLILFGRHSADTKRRGPVTQVLLSLLEPRLDGKRSEKQPCKFPAGQQWTRSDHDAMLDRSIFTPPSLS